MNLDPLFLEKLQSLPWFSKCGTPPPFPWAVPTTAKGALKAIRSLKWENKVLSISGDVSEQLSLRSTQGAGREYQDWNALVLDFKTRCIPALKEQWETALSPIALNTAEVLNDVSFNVLSLAVIDAYKAIVPTPPFFLHLLEVYAAGYLPCGWKGPANTGTLIVY